MSVARLPGPRAVGAEVGRALFFLLAGGVPASVVFWFRRNNHLINYPGLTTGILIVVILAVSQAIALNQAAIR